MAVSFGIMMASFIVMMVVPLLFGLMAMPKLATIRQDNRRAILAMKLAVAMPFPTAISQNQCWPVLTMIFPVVTPNLIAIGPAIVNADGTEEYWEHGCRVIKNDQKPPSARM